eukprot:15155301-Alexandrium_andersonii.AAC.1
MKSDGERRSPKTPPFVRRCRAHVTMETPEISDLERQTVHETPSKARKLVPVADEWLSSDAGA